jgi:hypothetical protein
MSEQDLIPTTPEPLGHVGVPQDVALRCETLWQGIQTVARDSLRAIRDELAPFGTFKAWCEDHGLHYENVRHQLTYKPGSRAAKQTTVVESFPVPLLPAAPTMPYHPLCQMFPWLSDDDYAAFVEDIRVYGLLTEIWTYQGQILDGKIRYQACLDAGVEPRFREWTGDPVALVISENVCRQSFTHSQRAMIAAEIEALRATEPDLFVDARTRHATPRADAQEGGQQP